MLRISKLILLLSLLRIAAAHERTSNLAPGHVSLRRASPDESQYCSLETCGNTEQKIGVCHRSLVPRVLEAPDPSSHPSRGHWYDPKHYGNNVDGFFRGEIAKRADTQTDIVPLYGGQVTSAYIRFKNEPRSLAILGFCGCIGLIVMSQSAVWMAHVYESPVLLNADTFDKNGIKVLKKGKGSSNMYYGLSDLSGNVFASDKDPVAVVFAPKEGGHFRYQPLMRKIDQMVEDLIGVEPKWVGYTPRRTGGAKTRIDFDCTRSDASLVDPPTWIGQEPLKSMKYWQEESRAAGYFRHANVEIEEQEPR
ncbi:hypothetical protein CORC01_02862 [Colletotrichum orchidophilum]|uniref:Cholera enterotoxin subunit A2 n=1 Tax=Colletotrichum orchidophilum TaxID=1209926 RepID=A0A1G4BKN9_9PEZI|nr:uncharacterized protein CORC01_02862 [Colletotrichum orchidophilum]OHF01984.1 hypothetical protein CORC01_02862 [Colletotrichum orchidophilum]